MAFSPDCKSCLGEIRLLDVLRKESLFEMYREFNTWRNEGNVCGIERCKLKNLILEVFDGGLITRHDKDLIEYKNRLEKFEIVLSARIPVRSRCVICMDRRRAICFNGCTHICICEECAKELKKREQERCPVCREPYTAYRVMEFLTSLAG